MRTNTSKWKFISLAPIPPMYRASMGRYRSAARSTSSSTTTGQKAITSKSSARCRAPGRAKPSSSAAENSPMWAGEKKIGNQPSAISAASATFFGPSAPSTIGMSLRRGWTMALSGLPSPVPPGYGRG